MNTEFYNLNTVTFLNRNPQGIRNHSTFSFSIFVNSLSIKVSEQAFYVTGISTTIFYGTFYGF